MSEWSRGKDKGGFGLPGLKGEILIKWYEYEVTRSGDILRLMVYSADQLLRSYNTQEVIDKARSRDTAWTDDDVIEKFPDVFGEKREPDQRGSKSNKERVAGFLWEMSQPGGCPCLPGRQLRRRKENGRTLNDPEHVRAIVAALRKRAEEKEWIGPDPAEGGKVYVPTRVMIKDYGISRASLQLHTEGRKHSKPTSFLPSSGKYFHPKKFKRTNTFGSSSTVSFFPGRVY